MIGIEIQVMHLSFGSLIWSNFIFISSIFILIGSKEEMGTFAIICNSIPLFLCHEMTLTLHTIGLGKYPELRLRKVALDAGFPQETYISSVAHNFN